MSEPIFLPTIVYSRISPGLTRPPFKSLIRTEALISGSYTSIAEVITRDKIFSDVVVIRIVAFEAPLLIYWYVALLGEKIPASYPRELL